MIKLLIDGDERTTEMRDSSLQEIVAAVADFNTLMVSIIDKVENKRAKKLILKIMNESAETFNELVSKHISTGEPLEDVLENLAEEQKRS